MLWFAVGCHVAAGTPLSDRAAQVDGTSRVGRNRSATTERILLVPCDTTSRATLPFTMVLRANINPAYVARLRQSGTPSRAKLITLPSVSHRYSWDKVEERIRTECGSFVPLTCRY
jgi:hypothetical protein